jgi:hypothetical protein
VAQRAKNLPISGPILQEKARQIATQIDEKTKFTASNGWLEKFTAVPTIPKWTIQENQQKFLVLLHFLKFLEFQYSLHNEIAHNLLPSVS